MFSITDIILANTLNRLAMRWLRSRPIVPRDLSFMNVPLCLDLAGNARVRPLSVEVDAAALGALGVRCEDYLRTVFGSRFDPATVQPFFLEMLKPRRVPTERGFVLGIYLEAAAGEAKPPHLAGVLYFLHSARDPGTWYIPLLLLEPAARGQGIGSAVHAAFTRWAMARGARQLMVAVADDNEAARHFWCERLGYAEADSSLWRQPGAPPRGNRGFVRPLVAAAPITRRVRLRAA